MAIHDTENLTQYPQNGSGPGSVLGSADISVDSFRAISLLAALQAVGVVLSVKSNQLAFDGPADVITDDLLGRMRAERDGLLRLVAHRDRGEVNDSLDPTTAIRCPWCDGIDLIDDHGGLRCHSCDRLAWANTAEGGLARCDVADSVIELVDPDSVPICPACGRWCDVLTLAESWRCSRCDPEANEPRLRTLRVLARASRS
ncbi:MAG TPA: hypothetical protein DDZ51_07840 [Planctomycetaceae bacterium]|nr:hypothetical protein [Planctomycetaceae bacterium]